MSYDLARIRLNGLIARGEQTHTYDLTPDGQRVAIFYTKGPDRLLRLLTTADQPPSPPEIRHALATIERHVHARFHHTTRNRRLKLKINVTIPRDPASES